MTKDQEDTIYSAYLGICVLQTMCRKAGLTMGAARSQELLTELSTAFPTMYERVLRGILRGPVNCERCGKATRDTTQSGEHKVCWDCATELSYEDLRASGGIVGAP